MSAVSIRMWLGLALVFCCTPSGHSADLGGSSTSMGASTYNSPIHPFFNHRLLIEGGLSYHAMNSGAAVGVGSAKTGMALSFEDDLGLPQSKSALDLFLRYRLSDRWMIESSYFSVPRSGTVSYARTVEFGRYSFNANLGLATDLDITSYRLGMGFSFFKSRDLELGATLSLYVSDFSASLGGSASLGALSVGFQTERYQAIAPLPAIGLYAHYALTSRWLVSGRADFMEFSVPSIKLFGLDLQNTGGRIINLEANTEYRLFDNLGIGVGYRYLDIALGATASGLTGIAGYSTSAPTAFVRASF